MQIDNLSSSICLNNETVHTLTFYEKNELHSENNTSRIRGTVIISCTEIIMRPNLDQNSEPFWKLISQNIKTVGPQHDWTIVLTSPIDSNTVNSQSIFIKNNQGQQLNDISISTADKSITIHAPPNGYNSGEIYTLYISQNLKSTHGKALYKNAKMLFNIS